jgi:hypothetical protein
MDSGEKMMFSPFTNILARRRASVVRPTESTEIRA